MSRLLKRRSRPALAMAASLLLISGAALAGPPRMPMRMMGNRSSMMMMMGNQPSMMMMQRITTPMRVVPNVATQQFVGTPTFNAFGNAMRFNNTGFNNIGSPGLSGMNSAGLLNLYRGGNASTQYSSGRGSSSIGGGGSGSYGGGGGGGGSYGQGGQSANYGQFSLGDYAPKTDSIATTDVSSTGAARYSEVPAERKNAQAGSFEVRDSSVAPLGFNTEFRHSLEASGIEISSGKALNAIFRGLQTMHDRGESTVLGLDIVRRLNFRPDRPNSGNPGLLKSADHLAWPAGLLGHEFTSERNRVNHLMVLAVREALGPSVDPDLIENLVDALSKMRQELSGRAEIMNAKQYAQAARFLYDLNDAARSLEEPGVGRLIQPSLSGEVTVASLAAYLSDHELMLAPAVPGDEPAYEALHHRLVTLASAGRGGVNE